MAATASRSSRAPRASVARRGPVQQNGDRIERRVTQHVDQKARLKGNNHVRVENREPSANLLVNVAEMFDVRLDKIGPSTGRLAI